MKMPESRRLAGREIFPLIFGGNVFGWTADEAASFALLDAFVEAGGNAIDTADVYSVWVPGHTGGESEAAIGRWLHQRGPALREKLVIATKVGHTMSPGGKGLRRDYILASVEKSLARLQTDYIDLYQAHVDDAETPLEETLAAFGDLIESGKVRAIGASNYGAARLREADQVARQRKLTPYVSLQPQYNLYYRKEFEQGLLPACRELGLAVIPYFSLASGFLTGKYKTRADFHLSQRGEGMARFLNPRGERIITTLTRIAEARRVAPAAVALAWLLAQPGVTAPIVSATKVPQMQAWLPAAELSLTTEELRALGQASDGEE